MKNTLIAIILFAYSAKASPTEYRPLMFVVPKHSNNHQIVYQQDFILMWTFKKRNSKAYADLDMKNMEYTLTVTNMFIEPFKTFVLKDTMMTFTLDMLPPDDHALITLEANVKDIRTGKITTYKTNGIIIKNGERQFLPWIHYSLPGCRRNVQKKLSIHFWHAKWF